ncbi:MAG: hypothetical protein WC842_01055 [Candidatus Paceibacterota bacterium]|jgi:hypothetical protein
MEPISKSNSQNKINVLSSILDSIGLTSDQKVKTLDNLSRAIYLNVLYQLSDRLSDSQKDELEKKQPQGQKEIAESLSSFFAPDEISRSFEFACNDVLGRFLDKI